MSRNSASDFVRKNCLERRGHGRVRVGCSTWHEILAAVPAPQRRARSSSTHVEVDGGPGKIITRTSFTLILKLLLKPESSAIQHHFRPVHAPLCSSADDCFVLQYSRPPRCRAMGFQHSSRLERVGACGVCDARDPDAEHVAGVQ